MTNQSSNTISLPRITAMGRQLEDTEPDYMAYYTSYDMARDEIERLRAALKQYGRHSHPNCHDLTLNPDGSFGLRNGCLCGLDAARSGNSSTPHIHQWVDGADPEQQRCTGCDSTRMTPESAVEMSDCPECKAQWELHHDQYCRRNQGRPNEFGGGLIQETPARVGCDPSQEPTAFQDFVDSLPKTGE